jgi:hypothetical protein
MLAAKGIKWTPYFRYQFKQDTGRRNGTNHERDEKAQSPPATVQGEGGDGRLCGGAEQSMRPARQLCEQIPFIHIKLFSARQAQAVDFLEFPKTLSLNVHSHKSVLSRANTSR